ncbi:6721_t:CDS:1, partial [Dentiscutata erythropus]
MRKRFHDYKAFSNVEKIKGTMSKVEWKFTNVEKIDGKLGKTFKA